MERSSTQDVSRLERKRAVPEPGCQGETHSRFLFSTSLCFSVLARSDRRLSRMHAFRSSRTRLPVIAEAIRYGSGRPKGRARTPIELAWSDRRLRLDMSETLFDDDAQGKVRLLPMHNLGIVSLTMCTDSHTRDILAVVRPRQANSPPAFHAYTGQGASVGVLGRSAARARVGGDAA